MKQKHIFFVQSDFHYIICKNIIHIRNIPKEYCYFACRRGVKVDSDDKNCDIFEEDRLLFRQRINYLIRNYRKVKKFFANCEVTAYIPFSFYFPQFYLFKDYVFFEEGLSSYTTMSIEDNMPGINREKRIYKCLKFFFPLMSNNMKGYIIGTLFNKSIPTRKTDLISCSKEAYGVRNHTLLNKLVYPIQVKIKMDYDIPDNSCVLVLDRFIEQGRTFGDIDNYKECLELVGKSVKIKGLKEVWAKFHPADFKNPEAKNIFRTLMENSGIRVHYFEGRLEYLALQNKSLTFIGSNSTILYYAPLLGQTNKSLSFSKYLASLDKGYLNYMQLYGGVDKFIEMFSRKVECI